MKYFLDTEFIENGPHHPIQLISIGIVAEDGRTFEAISNEFSAIRASAWVVENVLSKLSRDVSLWLSLFSIKHLILEFIGDDPNPEFWGYYADYDWVVFCQIFGTVMDLPASFPMHCRDIKQLCDEKGNPQLPKQGKGEHNALADAKWNKLAWEFLTSL